MPNLRIRIDGDALERILLGPAFTAALDAIAARVADQARGAHIMVEHEPGDVPLPITSRSEKGAAFVILDHPSGIAVEVKHRLLGRSLDAGRL